MMRGNVKEMPGSEKLRVSFDIDGVSADTVGMMLNVFNGSAGTSYTLADVDSWDWIRTEPAKHGIAFEDLYTEAWRRHDKMGVLVKQSELLALSLSYKLEMVTQALPSAVPYIKKWLLATFPLLDLKLIVAEGTSKANMPYQIYVDDKPKLVSELKGMDGKMLYLVMGMPGGQSYRYCSHVEASGNIVPVEDTHAAVLSMVKLARGEGDIHTSSRSRQR